MAPLALRLRADARFRTSVCVTGQHREMLAQVLRAFALAPDIDLGLMRPGQDPTDVTAAVLTAMRDVLARDAPDMVLVHGDTATSFAAALAAYHARVPVGHVEAGLRTHDLYAPWPEEGSRRLTGALATLHFAPTAGAAANLAREGVAGERVIVTGNTVIDALVAMVGRLRADPVLAADAGRGLPVTRGRMVLVTGHRRESFGDGFERICGALATIARRFPDADIVYPVHLNPSVQEPVRRLLAGIANVHLLPPQDYLPFVTLMDRSYLVLTDSGGVQEEAPSLGKPVLVMRDTTERPEAVEAGTAALVGTDADAIVAAVTRLLTDPDAYARMSRAHNPYGDGQACGRIVDALLAWAGG